jgi:hypothetical protein
MRSTFALAQAPGGMVVFSQKKSGVSEFSRIHAAHTRSVRVLKWGASPGATALVWLCGSSKPVIVN